jgi:hypothetical protein
MSEWKPLGARITLFTAAPSVGATAPALYRKVWGVEPDATQQQQHNPLMPSHAQGAQNEVLASCSTAPGRVDFGFSPHPPSLTSREVFPLISGNLKPRLDTLIDKVRENLTTSQVNRVGVYLQLVKLANSHYEANRDILSVVPAEYKFNLDSDEDFIFQFNKKTNSNSLDDVLINSINKWSVDQFQFIGFPFVPGQAMGGFEMTSKLQIAASVVLDYNNVPGNRVFSGLEQSSLLSEELLIAQQMMKIINLRVEGF